MNRPKQKWVVLTNDDCPCTNRVNLAGGQSELKLCVYHAKVQKRWKDWDSRPKSTAPPELPPLPEPKDEHPPEA